MGLGNINVVGKSGIFVGSMSGLPLVFEDYAFRFSKNLLFLVAIRSIN